MNFYEKTNFYPLLFILFLGCPLNSMWFKKMPKVKFSKAKTFMSLAATLATIKIKNEKFPNVTNQRIGIAKQANKEIEISEIGCLSDALLSQMHSQAKEISISYPKQSEKVAAVITKILEKERELTKDYYVLYHGQKGSFRVLQDFSTKLMNESIFETEKNTDFILLRDPQIFSQQLPQSAKIFLSNNEPEIHDFDEWDEQKDIRKHLLSVNLSLFGNTTKKGILGGECTLDYFLTNDSMLKNPSKKLLENFFTTHNISQIYLPEIILLQENLTSHGNLIQICIPKKDIDFYAYTSYPAGIPAEWPLSDILDNYPSQTNLINNHYLQARIVLSSGILNPNSGVKMYQYSLADEEDLSSYNTKLETLVSEIVRPEKFKKEKAAVQAKYAYLKDEADVEYAEWKKSRKQ